jgi:DNA-binding MurR/RpiR family transcriptional regulator
VARFIDENREIVLASSAAALGDRTGTSDATVVRTIQALGFAGLGDLKRAILNSIGQVSTPADDMRRTLGDLEKSTGHALDSVLQAHAEQRSIFASSPPLLPRAKKRRTPTTRSGETAFGSKCR